jgi:two-component SAPR family response regulator
VFLIIKTTTSENGITTKNINDNFWPGFTKNQAKENRGSSIKKLRNLLKQLTGADIVFRDKKWFFEVADYNYVDFIHYNNLKNIIKLQLKSETLSSKNIEAFLDILQKGNILQNIDSEWLDLIKNNISHEVTNLLSKIYSSKLTNNNLGISIAKTMLLFDDLNEEALQFLVQELISCGNHGQAKQTFEEFSRRFETLYNEPFPINYSSIQKRK